MITPTDRLYLRAALLEESNTFVAVHHRHHDRVLSHKFSLAACNLGGAIRGVAIVGRPVSRALDDGTALEVLRVATDGCPQACSFLYGACARAAKALGYVLILTYTLASEPGTSLRAAGWTRAAEVDGRDWSCPSRPRPKQMGMFGLTRDVSGEGKVRWERRLVA